MTKDFYSHCLNQNETHGTHGTHGTHTGLITIAIIFLFSSLGYLPSSDYKHVTNTTTVL